MKVKIKETRVKSDSDKPRLAQHKQYTALVVEQICWLVAVAGKTALQHLDGYVNGDDGRKLGFAKVVAKVVHMGPPNLTCTTKLKPCFKVSIPVAKIDKAVLEKGQCWKAMVGLAVVADQFKESRRPSGVMGLEASLPVIKQLLGKLNPSNGRRVFLEGPKAERAESKTTKPVWTPRTKQRDVVDWHFPLIQDPRLIGETILDLDNEGNAQRLPFTETSRHFVGWSRDAEVNTGKWAGMYPRYLGTHEGCAVGARLQGRPPVCGQLYGPAACFKCFFAPHPTMNFI